MEQCVERDEALPRRSTRSRDEYARPDQADADAALVEALRRDDPDAPTTLVETYGDRVYRLARRITGSNEDAEEVAQDALWTAARKIAPSRGSRRSGAGSIGSLPTRRT